MDDPRIADFKRTARTTWATGDYPGVAERDIWEVGERTVERAGIRPGEEVLDVACGSGNAALRAAEAGARVVGADLTPELLEAARERAGRAGVAAEWVEADAEALPFEEASFDVVISTFGCMFAPRHEVAAAEIARVLRPGGRIAITAWTPDGAIGRFFRTIAAYLPPPPDFASSPILWGDEAHVRGLFAGTGVEPRFERDEVVVRLPSPEQAVDYYATRFGPLMAARALTEEQGRWSALRGDLLAHFAGFAEGGGGPVVETREYVRILGTKG